MQNSIFKNLFNLLNFLLNIKFEVLVICNKQDNLHLLFYYLLTLIKLIQAYLLRKYFIYFRYYSNQAEIMIFVYMKLF